MEREILRVVMPQVSAVVQVTGLPIIPQASVVVLPDQPLAPMTGEQAPFLRMIK